MLLGGIYIYFLRNQSLSQAEFSLKMWHKHRVKILGTEPWSGWHNLDMRCTKILRKFPSMTKFPM